MDAWQADTDLLDLTGVEDVDDLARLPQRLAGALLAVAEGLPDLGLLPGPGTAELRALREAAGDAPLPPVEDAAALLLRGFASAVLDGLLGSGVLVGAGATVLAQVPDAQRLPLEAHLLADLRRESPRRRREAVLALCAEWLGRPPHDLLREDLEALTRDLRAAEPRLDLVLREHQHDLGDDDEDDPLWAGPSWVPRRAGRDRLRRVLDLQERLDDDVMEEVWALTGVGARYLPRCPDDDTLLRLRGGGGPQDVVWACERHGDVAVLGSLAAALGDDRPRTG